MTRAVRDRILKDANGDIGDHLCNHIHLTNCIHLKNHIHKNSPIVADRSLMRDLVVLQRSRSLRDPSASPPSWHSPSIVEWKFRHIFRGQPKRHLLTTGWSVFVSAKRLVAGDSVLFIWNEKNQLLLGIRHATRPQTVMPPSVLSSDNMHNGLLAAAAHAASTNSCFTVFYNPRASPSEFVVPLSKYVKAVFHTRVSVGMRFRMLFETEESSVRRKNFSDSGS
ncbi:auxin response factor 12-like [Quercus robur]|uniref:auxin response factor 12-like n=1 Tax=Quercus robur TaxID=38942 RepID=UPI0021615D37|nr:auxin response factor 12-like [Quercus robur]XP_050273900.1 auxin response factor 12-like [Quercus robur]